MPFSLLETLPPALEQALAGLRRQLSGYGRVVVAYSGGVDSALVAALAAEVLAERALAITGVSPALAPHLLQEARDQARWLDLAHREVATAELADPAYSTNPVDRCYACKRELHSVLAPIAAAAGGAMVLDGVNRDDLGDHRPGIRAAQEFGVISPLAEHGLDKPAVRQLSRALGLPWWDKPAQPCLASRFPYGEPIDAGRLGRVARAEAWLRQQGFRELRVRSHGDTARIELPAGQLDGALLALSRGPLRQQLLETFQALGFTAVGLDLEGLVSGKLNRALAAAAPPLPADPSAHAAGSGAPAGD